MTSLDAEVHPLEPYRAKRSTLKAAAPGAFASLDAEIALRRAAISADASATSQIPLALLWRELARGTSRVVDAFFSDERCYLVLGLQTDDSATPMPITGRRLEILEAVLGGLRQKSIAIDLSLAPSTVALNSRLALEALGMMCKPSRAHPLLMLAARAASEPLPALASCSTFVTCEDRELRVIGIARPDQRLAAMLPSAELAVIRSLVEGLSYGDIARRRGTSTRTVANQISAVFRRLRVSGRNELVQRLFFDDSISRDASRPVCETLVPPDGQAKPAQGVELSGARRSA
jgi:DNA-binding NarL/FixJ family response regulator